MKRRSRIFLGLNSGTSADGVDAVACEITGRGAAMRVRYLGHVSRPYPKRLRERVLRIMAPAETTTQALCLLNTAIGEAFADAASEAMTALELSRVDGIGSHGQTICHVPGEGGRKGGAERGTLQIGEAAIIAERIGSPVVSNFRQADMAAGGQGAPLVPWTDFVLFRHATKGRIIQNIGGIANLTWIPPAAKPGDVVAFDTGPGNMMIDALVARFSNGRQSFDRDGRRAAKGRVIEAVVDALARHPYCSRRPPKSCGREEFGVAFVESLLAQFGEKRYSADDWIATATCFTAACIAGSYSPVWIESLQRDGRCLLDDVILCGGGARNPTLLGMLRDFLGASTDSDGEAGGESHIAIATTDDYGFPSQAKEGISFAMLAAARLDGVPANLPQVTGARRAVVLGQLAESN